MKVLFLNYEYPPLGGGAANATAALLTEWQAVKGVEVLLVTSSIGREFERKQLGPDIKIHRLPIGKNPRNLHHQSLWNLLVYSARAWWYVRQLIRSQQFQFDVTLAFFGVPCGFVALLLKWEFGSPYIVSLRGSDVPGYSRKYAWLYPLLRPIIRFVWKGAAAVIPNSAGLEALARKTAPSQSFTIIENGVDTKRFMPDPSKRLTNLFVITPGASRVTERKGLNYLIEAVALLASRYPHIQLKVMGDGSARPSLEVLVKEKKLEDKVAFLGRIPREKTVPYYQEASLFVLPSLNEGMSNAMLEALASGLPIIATDTGGTRELVTDGVNGIVVPLQSAEKIAEAIEGFLQDSDRLRRFGEASRARAEAQSWSSVARQFRNILEETKKSS